MSLTGYFIFLKPNQTGTLPSVKPNSISRDNEYVSLIREEKNNYLTVFRYQK